MFSVLDLSGAFNQLHLDEESAKLLDLNTHRGLYGTSRLTYFVKVDPSQFQPCIDKVLSGIDNVFCYIDDILFATTNSEEHNFMRVLGKVFERLARYNVKLNKSKCLFLQDKVNYLGHELHGTGVRPLQNKIEAIVEAPVPKNVSELRSFLGMINYYAKFVPDLATKLHPLYCLLRQSTAWKWSRDCDKAFRVAKREVASAHVLTHFDPSLPLVLAVDASPYGLGASLCHRMPDGSEKPIAFASRALSTSERNYAQVEKEGLAIIFGVKKFHMYLYGRKDKFLLVTDHQPLVRIFGSKTGISAMAAARMQRWALLLSGYSYTIEYRKGEDNPVADMLSRLPVDGADSAHEDENFVFLTTVNALPVTAQDISEATRKDSTLSKVLELTLNGWPSHIEEGELKPYHLHKDELSLEDDCVLWGRRVIIPDACRERVLAELHECHPGIVKMKSLARSYFWWPGLDADIEDLARSCAVCTQGQAPHKEVPLLLWPWASDSWQRIHVDYLEIKGQMFFLVIDAYSKWIESFPMSSTTSKATIDVLRSLFSRYGLPSRLVSDNGPQFISAEFRDFMQANGIQHTLTPPYHPSSNGQAEIGVKIFKSMYVKSLPNAPMEERVAKVLFKYRNLPHTTTGKTPAELFLKRQPRSLFTLLKPDLRAKVESKQETSKLAHDGNFPKHRVYDLYQRVGVKQTRGGRDKWIPGTIVARKGPNSYLVRTPGNVRRFVHADHLRHDDSNDREIIDVSVRDLTRSSTNDPMPTVLPTIVKSPVEPKSVPPASVPEPSDECKDFSNDSTCTSVEKPPLRRSTRIIKPRAIMDL